MKLTGQKKVQIKKTCNDVLMNKYYLTQEQIAKKHKVSIPIVKDIMEKLINK